MCRDRLACQEARHLDLDLVPAAALWPVQMRLACQETRHLDLDLCQHPQRSAIDLADERVGPEAFPALVLPDVLLRGAGGALERPGCPAALDDLLARESRMLAQHASRHLD